MRGRKPKPSAIKALEGHPGKRAANHEEPQPPPPEPAFDVPPPELAAIPGAVAEWQRLAPMLRQCRQITEADRAALVAVCLEWARYLDALGRVQTLGLLVPSPNGYPIMNPYLPIATKALANCTKLWPELGLTPSSRSRVRMTDPARGSDDFAEFDVPPFTGVVESKTSH